MSRGGKRPSSRSRQAGSGSPPARERAASSASKASRFTAIIEVHGYVGGMPYVAVPADVAACFPSDGGSPRVLASFARAGEPATMWSAPFHCGLMPLGDGRSHILMTSKIREAIGAEVGEPVAVNLVPDDSPYGLPMPDELAEALAMDELGAARFSALTPGRKRGILAMVARHKTVDKRVEHALAILAALGQGETDLKTLARARLDHLRRER